MAKLPENFKIITDLEYITKAGDMFATDNDWLEMTKGGGLDGRTWKDIKKNNIPMKIAAADKPKNQFNFPPAPDGFRMLSHAEMLNHTFSAGEYFINSKDMGWDKVYGYDGFKVKNELDKHPVFAVCVPTEFKPKQVKFPPPPPDGYKVLPPEEAIKYILRKGDYFIYNGLIKWQKVSDWHARKVKDMAEDRVNFTVAIDENPIKIEEIKDPKYVFVKHFKHYYTNTKCEEYWNSLPLNYYGKTVEKFRKDNGEDYRLGKQKPRFETAREFPFGY